MRRWQLAAADGRKLDVVDAGPLDGLPIVVHHGTPGSAMLAPEWIADAESRGLRLISHSRPGYAASDRRPGRTVGQVVEDVGAVTNALGIVRFATWGLSGGGPHALACAALMPDRVVAASSISGVAPYPAPGMDWLAGMGEDNVEEFNLALSGDEAGVLGAAEQMAAELRNTTVEQVRSALASLLSPEDQRIMKGPFGDYLAASFAEALAAGGAGSADDDLAFVRPWGFEVEQIAVPTQVWQGGQDLMAPAAHGAWLAGRIPGVDAHLEADFGHLTVAATGIGAVHSWLAQHF
ncbi:MAG: alpha/beta fold hydrolase [Candidatus Dormiibacterota bacterium]